MKHADIIALIEKGIRRGETAWADLGSGDGAFTLALRELLGPDADIYSVDADESRLKQQERAFRSGPGVARTTFVKADFTRPLSLPALDGILMANSLHFVEDQPAFLQRLRKDDSRPVRRLVRHSPEGGGGSAERDGGTAPTLQTGKLLIVEYDINRGSVYVPYPVSYSRLGELAAVAGFDAPIRLAAMRSRYWSRIYSALVLRGSKGLP